MVDDRKIIEGLMGKEFKELGLSKDEVYDLERIVKFIILMDWSKEEERLEKMFDLSLLIDKFKKNEQ